MRLTRWDAPRLVPKAYIISTPKTKPAEKNKNRNMNSSGTKGVVLHSEPACISNVIPQLPQNNLYTIFNQNVDSLVAEGTVLHSQPFWESNHIQQLPQENLNNINYQNLDIFKTTGPPPNTEHASQSPQDALEKILDESVAIFKSDPLTNEDIYFNLEAPHESNFKAHTPQLPQNILEVLHQNVKNAEKKLQEIENQLLNITPPSPYVPRFVDYIPQACEAVLDEVMQENIEI